MGIERPNMNLIDPSQQGKVTGQIQKDTPDNILLHGKFSSGPLVNYELRTLCSTSANSTSVSSI